MDLILRFIGENNKLDITNRFLYELDRYPFVVAKGMIDELEKMCNNITESTSLGMVIHPNNIAKEDRHKVPDPLYFEVFFKCDPWQYSDAIEVVNVNRITCDMYLDMLLENQTITKVLEKKIRNVL